MVRKRTRPAKTRRYSRKDYESDENESDDSLDLDSPPSSPAPKRYGLRQRKQPIFCEDFDYDDEDELNVNKHRSDDEEYDVEVDLNDVKETQFVRTNRTFPRRESTRANVSVSTIEPEVEEVSMDNGLIDFEDVIRADVVVNKQRVDYDNIINKTEIQIETIGGNNVPVKPVREKGKRGRKPKPKPQIIEEIQMQPLAVLDDNSSCAETPAEDDSKLEVQLDPANFVQTDSDDSNPPAKSNGVLSEVKSSTGDQDKPSEKPVENGVSLGSSRIDDIEKFVPPELDEKEKEVVLSNEYLLANSFDYSADEFLQKQAEIEKDFQEEEDNFPVFNFDDDSNSDDDVVIIEKKPEIIVLDDD